MSLMFTVFQTLVRRWVVRAFGEEVANDRAERTYRFLKEALELAQCTDCTQAQAHALVEYVYGRKAGQPEQETGGVLLTLAALCAARHIDMSVAAATELARVNRPETLERIREKQAAKKRDIPLSPLPGQVGSNLPPRLHKLCGGNLLDVRTNSSGPKWWCSQCRTEVLAENTLSAKPDFTPPGQLHPQLTKPLPPPPAPPPPSPEQAAQVQGGLDDFLPEQPAAVSVPLDTKCLIHGRTLGEELDNPFLPEKDQ